MTLTRRALLTKTATLSLVMALPTRLLAASKDARWIGCRQEGEQNFATLLSGDGTRLSDIPLPDRGHACAIAPDRKSAVIMARRPGTYAIQIDLENGRELARFESETGQHFYGHAVFSTDGTKLFTTENHIESGAGLITMRDVHAGFKPVSTFSSAGIGPHELCLMEDGRTLAVANGGIMTRPETGRTGLNLDSMEPSLTLIDSESGELMARHALPAEFYQLSIRHMSTFGKQVALALQFEGPKNQPMPLLALFDGEYLQLSETPPELARSMRNYAGSIAHDPSGTLIAMTCPKGNRVTFWNATDGTFLGQQTARDICGLAKGGRPGEFFVTAADQAFFTGPGSHRSSEKLNGTQWDNHLTYIG